MANPIVEQEEKMGSLVAAVSEDLTIQVSRYKGKVWVDLRKWYEDRKSGGFARKSNGLNVELDEWNDLVTQIEELDEFVQKNKDQV